MKKRKTAQEIVRNIRTIITYILMIVIYILIWHFVYNTFNDDIKWWAMLICFVVGWYIIDWYEVEVYCSPINKFWKFWGILFGIPILFAVGITKFLNYLLDKEKITSKPQNENKMQQSIKIQSTGNIPEIHSKVISSDNSDFNFKEEYYCDRCFKKISEEEYELYDCMCAECFEEVNNGII